MYVETGQGQMRKRQQTEQAAPIEPAGWPPTPWCKSAGISRALYYRLPPEQQPHSTKIRKRRIIFESPRDWLMRMAAEQAAE
jgi:hypothetical protein